MQVTIVDKLKGWLGQKSIVPVCLLVAIVGKSLIALSYSSLKGDKSLYLLLTKSFLETGVLAEPVQVVENGTSYYLYNPAVHSPLYSLMAAPLLWITKSYFLSQYILSVFSWIIFYTALYQVVRLIFGQRWHAALFLLCTAFFLYPHELASPPKDTFAVGFALWSIVFISRLVSSKPTRFQAVLLGVALTCLAAIKLLYAAVAIVLLLITLACFFKKRQTHHRATAFLAGTVLFTFLLLYAFIFRPAYGLADQALLLSKNSTNTSGGFHPEYLKYTYPFITSSFLNTHLWAVQVERLTALTFTDVMQIFFRMDVVLFFGIAALLLYFRRQIMRSVPLTLLVCASLTMIGVVCGLSLTGRGTTYKSNDAFWTFVMDARSFLLPMITLQVALFLFVFQTANLRLLRSAAFFLFFITCAHGFYFTVKETASLRRGSDEDSNDAQTKIVALLSSPNQTEKQKLVTSDLFLQRYAQVNHIESYSFSNLPPDLSWMKKGDRFLIATFPQDSSYRHYFPPAELLAVDTIPPFLLHRYTVK